MGDLLYIVTLHEYFPHVGINGFLADEEIINVTVREMTLHAGKGFGQRNLSRNCRETSDCHYDNQNKFASYSVHDIKITVRTIKL